MHLVGFNIRKEFVNKMIVSIRTKLCSIRG